MPATPTGRPRPALRAFTRRSVGADVALVFYAGHGIEMDRVNYLVPVDARLERDIDVRYEAVTLDDMLQPLVAYAAAAGTTAAAGRGRNSPYTAALLAHLQQPLEIGLLFRRVRPQVLASTNGQQRPHEYQSLVGEHYLSVPPTAEAVTVAAAVPAVVAARRRAVPPAAADVEVGDLHVAGLRQKLPTRPRGHLDGPRAPFGAKAPCPTRLC